MSDKKPCMDCQGTVYDFNLGDRCSDCQRAYSRKVAAQTDLDATKLRTAVGVAIKSRLTRMVMVIWFVAWLVFGGGWALYERYNGGSKGCVYRSLASLLNPGFVLGCELLRERWEIGK